MAPMGRIHASQHVLQNQPPVFVVADGLVYSLTQNSKRQVHNVQVLFSPTAHCPAIAQKRNNLVAMYL